MLVSQISIVLLCSLVRLLVCLIVLAGVGFLVVWLIWLFVPFFLGFLLWRMLRFVVLMVGLLVPLCGFRLLWVDGGCCLLRTWFTFWVWMCWGWCVWFRFLLGGCECLLLVCLFVVFVIVFDCWFELISWLVLSVNSVDLYISIVLFIWLVFALLCLCLLYWFLYGIWILCFGDMFRWFTGCVFMVGFDYCLRIWVCV